MEGKLDESTLNLIQSFKNGNVSLKGFLGTTAGAAIKIAALAAVCYGAYKAFDYFYDSIEETKKKVSNLMDEYNSAIKTANENAKTIDSLANRYAELSKGVNNLGENVSLTTDEYTEYNKLVNQIAEISPTLVKGYTNEGNAILSLKGNVEQLKESYKEAQKEAYNLLIASGKDANGNDIIKQWNDKKKTGLLASIFDFGANDVNGAISVQEAIDQLEGIQDISLERYYELQAIAGHGTRKEIQALTETEKNIGYKNYLSKALGLKDGMTEKEFVLAKKQAKILVQTYRAEIESGLSDMETLANAFLMTNEGYDKLDEQTQKVASILVNNLNENIANSFGDDKNNVGQYVEDIIQILSSNSEIKEAVLDLFTLDTSDLSINEAKSQIDSYVNTIAKILKEDPIELKARLGFEEQDILYENYNRIVENAVGRFTSNNRSTENIDAERKALNDFAKENSINTQDEIAVWNKCLEESRTREEAMKKYLTTSKDVVKLVSKSEMIDSINELSKGFDILDEIYKDVKDVGDFDFTNLASDKFTEAFKGLEDEYTEFIETVSSSPNDIDACQSAFNKLTTAYINQAGILDDVNEQNAQVAIAMLKNMGVTNSEAIVLSILSERTAELAFEKQFLADTGKEIVEATEKEIANYLLIQEVTDDCGAAYARMALKKILVNTTTIETGADMNNIIKLAKAANLGSKALAQFARFKADLELADKNGDEERRRLVLDRIREYSSQLQAEIDSVTEVNYTNVTTPSESKDEWLEKYKEELSILQNQLDMELINEQDFYNKSEALLNQYLKDTPAHVKKYAEEISDAEKSLHDSWNNLYEEQKSALDEALGDGKINAHNYAKELKKLIDKYYVLNDATKTYGKYTKELEQAQRDLAEAQKETLDIAIEAVEMLYDKQIEKYEEAQEAFEKAHEEKIEAIDAEIKGFENQVEALDDLIEQKEKEIEALEDANDERERTLRLQKVQAALDEALNNRSKATIIGGIVTYVQDESAIKDAKEELENIAHENAIKELEAQKELLEANKESIEKQIELLEKQKEVIEEAFEKSNEQYEKLTEALTQSKNRWSDLGDIAENASKLDTLESVLAEMNLSLEDLYTMSDETFSQFKTKYIENLKLMHTENDQLNTDIDKIAAFDGSNTVDNISQIEQALLMTKQAAQDASNSIMGSSSDSEENKKEESEGDSNSLTGAIQESKVVASDNIPQMTSMVNQFDSAVANATNEVNSLANAITNLPDKKVITIETTTTGGGSTSSVGATKKGLASQTHMNKYAKGVHNIRQSQNAWTQEYNEDEVVISPVRGAVFTPLKPGDSVLSNAMTNNLWDWSQIQPTNFYNGLEELAKKVNTVPTYVKNNSASGETHFSFNITMPNVTDSTAAETLANDLKSIAVEKFRFFNKR